MITVMSVVIEHYRVSIVQVSERYAVISESHLSNLVQLQPAGRTIGKARLAYYAMRYAIAKRKSKSQQKSKVK